VALLAAAWLGLGLANVWRGLDQTGPGYYRWAFVHHAYSDVIALWGSHYGGGARPVPYLEDRIEYPPLLGAALWLPAFAPGGAAGHLALTALLLAACLAATLLALGRLPGAAPWWLGATPALAYYAFLNWDLLPIALTAGSLLLLARAARPGAAAGGGALAGLGVAAKLFPAALVPPALGALAPGPRRALLGFGAALAGAWLLVNGPLALVAPENWSWFFRFNGARGAENSIWHALGLLRGPWLDALSLGPVALAAAWAAWCSRRTALARGAGDGDGPLAARLGAALVLLVWIALNKVWSPQYALWGFLAGALVAGPGWLFAALTVASVADYHLEFEVRARRWDPWFVETLVKPSELVRTALWLALAAIAARRLWRLSSRASRSG
jgi:hypothetical protein